MQQAGREIDIAEVEQVDTMSRQCECNSHRDYTGLNRVLQPVCPHLPRPMNGAERALLRSHEQRGRTMVIDVGRSPDLRVPKAVNNLIVPVFQAQVRRGDCCRSL